MKYVLLALVLLLPAAPVTPALAQDKPEPLDGPSRPVRDSLLEQLAGRWRVTRQMRGTSVNQVKDAATCIVSNQGGIMTTHSTLILGH